VHHSASRDGGFVKYSGSATIAFKLINQLSRLIPKRADVKAIERKAHVACGVTASMMISSGGKKRDALP
jgi:hypothetical protein